MTEEKLELNHSELNHFVEPASHPVLRSVEVRCPDCRKLYVVALAEAHSDRPHFECVACRARFSFPIPPGKVKRVIAQLEKKPSIEVLQNAEIKKFPQALFDCPKCHQVNPKNQNECVKCGVIFDKFALVKGEEKVSDRSSEKVLVLPSLVKSWQDLMKDYQNLAKHMSFVDRCEELQALPFALKKYKDLKVNQPQDVVARQMFDSVFVRLMRVAGSAALRWVDRVPRLNQGVQFVSRAVTRFQDDVPWVKIRRASPLALSFLMILAGMTTQSLRNLVGMGCALLFLSLGITWFLNGRLRLSDFWGE